MPLLDRPSRVLRERPRRNALAAIGSNAAILVHWLAQQPPVAKVYAAPIPSPMGHESKGRAPQLVVAGLISIILAEAWMAPVFYDALNVAKGPGFGTNFTLSCPYTILAHYGELEWAESCGVDASLVRNLIWLVQATPARPIWHLFACTSSNSSRCACRCACGWDSILLTT